MVSSTTRKIFSFAISLLVAVISLTTAAQAAIAPATVTSLNRYTPSFAGNPGKMVRDTAGNFYVADFWGKRIVKLDNQGGNAKYIATAGRPSAVYPLPDGRLVVAISVPSKYVAFYSQAGDELAQFGAPANPYFRPVAITRDKVGNIYVLDSGDISETDTVNNVPRVRVYDAAGVYKYAFGAKTLSYMTSTTGGTFKQPMGIAYEKASDRIVVVDTLNGRIQFFKPYDVSVTCDYDVAAPLKTFGGTAGRVAAPLNAAAKFYNPVDIAFEYNGAALNRMFVLERGHNEVAVVDAVTNYGYYRTAINLTTYPAIGKGLVQPTSLAFANKITAGAAVPGGVLYVSNAQSSEPADIFAMGVDGGTLSAPGVTVNITSAVPATTTATSLLVSGTVSPSNEVFCSVNGGADQSAGTGWSTTLSLVAGYNHIVCKSTLSDLTAYAEADVYSMAVIGAAPTVTVTAPAAGLYTKNSTVTVSGTSDTANATVRLTNALNSFTKDTTTAADKTWSAVVTLADGSNEITPTIWKAGTDVGTGTTVTVVADSVAPTVTLGFLSNTRVTGSAVQNLDGIVNKAVANVTSIEVNGIDVPATSMLGTADNKTYFSVPVTLNRGSNTVTVSAVDKAGRIATDSRTVTLDQDLPAFTVALPADNSYMNAAAPSNGTAVSFYTSVNAAGQNATPASGLWTATAFTLGAGFNAYEFTATGVGKSTTEKRTVINGTTGNAAAYAKLAITSPTADFATNSDPVLIQGFVAPGSPTPTIIVDNGVSQNVTTYNPVDGSFSHSVSLVSQGNHTVKVTANAATSAVRNIIYDIVAPEFSLQADSKPAPVTVSGSLEASAKITAITASLSGSPVSIPLSVISYDAYDAAVDAVVWHANLTGYTYDTISFAAVDPAGNASALAYSAVVPTGDVDGDGSVRLADALSALRHVAGTQALTGNPFVQADVGLLVENRAGRDGKVDIGDAGLILKKSYGLLSF